MSSETKVKTDQSGVKPMSDALFEIHDLEKTFESREGGFFKSLISGGNEIRAVDDVSFSIKRGEVLGLAGQSGCGKSTLGELLLALQKPTGGEIYFDGENVSEYTTAELQEYRRRCQVIFQDPYEALNPRFPVSRIVTEPLIIHGIGDSESRLDRAMEALEDAGLKPAEKYIDKVPKELSGGERQRVCIARALVLDPDFIVADEPVSMLDVSVRTSILHLFKELQEKRDLTMLYVSHNLSTINYLADRTMVMYLGDVVELGDTEQVIHESSHPYTEALVKAVPARGKKRESLNQQGKDVPKPIDLPDGCRYESICPYATEKCVSVEPELKQRNGGSHVACHHPITDKTLDSKTS